MPVAVPIQMPPPPEYNEAFPPLGQDPKRQRRRGSSPPGMRRSNSFDKEFPSDPQPRSGTRARSNSLTKDQPFPSYINPQQPVLPPGALAPALFAYPYVVPVIPAPAPVPDGREPRRLQRKHTRDSSGARRSASPEPRGRAEEEPRGRRARSNSPTPTFPAFYPPSSAEVLSDGRGPAVVTPLPAPRLIRIKLDPIDPIMARKLTKVRLHRHFISPRAGCD